MCSLSFKEPVCHQNILMENVLWKQPWSQLEANNRKEEKRSPLPLSQCSLHWFWGPLIGWATSRSQYTSVYGQDTQDGGAIGLCTSPGQPVPASPTHYSYNWPSTYLSQAPAQTRSEHLHWDSLSKGCWEACPPLAGFPDNQEPTSNQFPW